VIAEVIVHRLPLRENIFLAGIWRLTAWLGGLESHLGANDCSVPVLQGIPALLQMINSSPDCLTPMQVQAIAQAVENFTLTTNITPIPKPIPKPKPVKRKNPTS
jgi:hypothetical protein